MRVKYVTDKDKISNIKVPSRSDIEKLLHAAKDSAWYFELLLMVTTGVRSGEMRGIKSSDFNDKLGTLTIQRQLSNDITTNCDEDGIHCKKNIKVSPTKGTFGKRCFTVLPELIEEKNKRIERNERLKEKAGIDPIRINEGYLVLNQEGGFISDSTFRSFLSCLCVQEGITVITPHSLRHFFATVLLESKCGLDEVSNLLGYCSIDTTLTVYHCITDEMVQKVFHELLRVDLRIVGGESKCVL